MKPFSNTDYDRKSLFCVGELRVGEIPKVFIHEVFVCRVRIYVRMLSTVVCRLRLLVQEQTEATHIPVSCFASLD